MRKSLYSVMRKMETDSLSSLFYKYKPIAEQVENGAEFLTIPTLAENYPPTKGRFYSYQDQFARAAQIVQYGVCTYEPGTGKTRTYIDLGYSMIPKKITGNPYVDQYISTGKTYVQKIVISTSNDDLAKSVLADLRGFYNEKALDLHIIDKYYEVSTHGKITSKLLKIYKEKYMDDEQQGYIKFCEYLHDTYSNCVFFFDESAEIAGEQLKDINMDFLSNENFYRNDMLSILKKEYHMIHLLCHSGENVRRYAFTGTIMKNDVSEFSTSYNLVLPRNDQINVHQDFSLWGNTEFDKYFLNNNFHIEQSTSNLVENYPGKYTVNGIDQMKWFKCVILEGSPQEKAYLDAYRSSSKNTDHTIDYTQQLVSTKGTVLERLDYSDPKFRNYIEKLDNLKKVGCKEATVRRIIEAHKDTKIAIFCEYVEDSGVIATSTDLQIMGYEEYNVSFKDEKDLESSLVLSLTPTGRIEGTKKKRYIIASNLKNSKTFTRVMALWNSVDNLKGEYIHCFIGSPTVQHGISLYDTTVCILINTQWTFSSYRQFIARIERVGGFVATVKNQIKLKEEGNYDDDPHIINLHIYPLVAVFQRTNWKLINDPPVYSGEIMTLDQHKLVVLARKQHEILRINKAMATRSVCFKLNYKRNTKYKLPIPNIKESTHIDTSVFYNLYLQDYVSDIKQYIIGHMETRRYEYVDKIIELTSSLGYPLQVYKLAIEELIKSNTVIRNSYGVCTYLCYSNGVLYVSPINEAVGLIDNYYSGKLVCSYKQQVTSDYPNIENILNTVMSQPGDLRDNLVNAVTFSSKAGLKPVPGFIKAVLEFTYSNFIVGNDTFSKIFELFSFYCYKLPNNRYFHTLIVNESSNRSYAVMTSIFNPKQFRYYDHGKWVDSKEKIFVDFVCDKLKNRFRKRLGKTNKDRLLSPMFVDVIKSPVPRLIRAKFSDDGPEQIAICGCVDDYKINGKISVHGTLLNDIPNIDLITSQYYLDANRKPNNYLNLIQISIETYYEYMENAYDEYDRNEDLSLTQSKVVVALSYLLRYKLFNKLPLHYKPNESLSLINGNAKTLVYNSIERIIDSPEKKINPNFPIPSNIIKPSDRLMWIGMLISNFYLLQITKTEVGRESIIDPLIIDFNDINQREYLVYVYNWIKHYGNSTSEAKSDLIDLAKEHNQYLVI